MSGLVVPWETVKAKCRERISDLATALETAPLDRIHAIQGEIRSLRFVCDLEHTLAKEAQFQRDAKNI